MFIVDLIYNLSVLVALSSFSVFLSSKFKISTLTGKIFQGLLFGTTAIIGMMYPFQVAPGVIFDGRSIVISLCSLFFGPISGVIAAVIGIFFRFQLGGSGVLTGILWILSSFIFGMIFHQKFVNNKNGKIKNIHLYMLGLIVNTFSLLLIFALPSDLVFIVLKKISFTIIVFYPIITLLIGKILLDQQENANNLGIISEREKLFRTTLYSIGDAVITTDILGNILNMNPVAEKLTGWLEIDAKGKKLKEIFSIIDKITREEVENPIAQIVEQNKVLNLKENTILISKNGNEIPISDSGAPIYNNDGEITGIVLVFRDQTLELESQKVIKESEEIFKQFLINSPIYVFFKDTEIRPTRLSQNYEKLLNRPLSEIIGKNMNELFPSELAKQMVEDDKKMLAEGKVVEVIEEFNDRIYKTIKFPIIVDEKPIYLAGFTLDITDSQKFSESLIKSEKSYREIFNSTNEAIFLHDADTGKVIDVNDSMIKMYGFENKEAVFENGLEDLSANVEPYTIDTALEKIQKTISEGPQIFEWLAKKKNGELFWLEISLRNSSIGGEGKVLAVARDITEKKNFEEKIEEATKLQKAILDNAGYAIVSTSLDGKILSFNPEAEKMLGYTADELINKKTPIVFHDFNEVEKRAVEFSKELGEFVEPGFEVFVIKSNHGIHNENEWTYIRKDGSRFPVNLKINAIRNSKGEINGYLGISNDITERKQAEKLLELRTFELEESEKKYRTLFEKSRDAMLIIDNNIFVDCNNATLKMLGMNTKEELRNTHPSTLSPPKQPDGRFSFEKAEEMMAIAKKNGSHRFEWLHKRADGECFYCDVSLTIIPFQGKEIIHTAWQDITERKLAQEKNIKLSKGVEQSPATIFITDKDGFFEYVNPKFTEITGYTFSDVIGKTPNILKSGLHEDEFYKNMWETILEGKTWINEILNKKKNGELFWEQISISPIKNENNEITNFISINEDISHRKKLVQDLIEAKEKAEIANQLKSEFLAQVSHEIRSPINTMVSFTSLIEDEFRDKSNEELEECFGGIESASKRVIRTIDLILNMSELQLGTYEISKRKININEILVTLSKEYRRVATSKKLKLNVSCSTDNCDIFSDEYAIKQIFANLIDNAIKYTKVGSVDVYISSDKNEKIVVKIADSGIGISEKYLETLFEPFTQEEQGYTRRFEGNGLGMSLVKRYCDLIEAEISVKSEKNKGTEFTVII